MPRIVYQSGYKYQTKEDYAISILIYPQCNIETQFISLNTDGTLIIKKGYAWDGASGPIPDLKTVMRGSLVHDALYQLMREKKIDHDTYRYVADLTLRDICLEDGMSRLLAWIIYTGVRKFGDPFADPNDKRPLEYAPHK